MDLHDELVRSKRLLDEKHYESGRLIDEAGKKGDQNLDLRDQLQSLEKELDMIKSQRADVWREINRLKEVNDMKVREAADQGEKMKALDYDLSRTQARIEDCQKLIDARNYDLRNKQVLFEDTQKELARLRDSTGRMAQEN